MAISKEQTNMSIMDMSMISSALIQGNNGLQKEAFAYFENLKSDPNGWKICMEAIIGSSSSSSGASSSTSSTPTSGSAEESKIFFCLLVIENYIKTRYEMDIPENQRSVRQFIFSWFNTSSSGSSVSNHNGSSGGNGLSSSSGILGSNHSMVILNKFAQVVDFVFLADFPNGKWNSFFQDFMSVCLNEKNTYLFLKILMQINSDIADRELNKTQKENDRNNRIKDMIRELCMLELAQFWFTIINTYRETCPVVVCSCLEVIGVYVSWIDISLITNDCFMSTLFNLFEKSEFRCSVCECFNGILHKGMDPLAKTELIQQFMSVESIKCKLEQLVQNNRLASSSLNRNSRDEEFLVKLSKLINTIGIELVEAFKKIKPKQNMVNGTAAAGNTDSNLSIIGSAIESKFPLLCLFLNDKNPVVSLQIHPFCREYIQWIKNNQKRTDTNGQQMINDTNLNEIISIFSNIIISKSKLSDEYDFDDAISDDYEDNMNTDGDMYLECRKSCKILFENLMVLNSGITMEIVAQNVIEPVLNGWRNGTNDFRDVEISLYMFYLLGENLNSIQDQKRIETLLTHLITSGVSSYPHPSVQLTHFELIIRYDKFFSGPLSFLIPDILISFLDERGFKNSNSKLRSRVNQLFNKFIRSNVKGKGLLDKIQGFSMDIIQKLQPFLKPSLATVDSSSGTPSLSSSTSSLDHRKDPNHHHPHQLLLSEEKTEYYLSEDDQLLLYESVSCLIISNTSFDPIKKHLLLQNYLLDDLWSYFNELYAKLSEIHINTGVIPSLDSLQVSSGVNGSSGCLTNGGPSVGSKLMSGSSLPNVISDGDLYMIKRICERISHVISLVARTSKAFSNIHPMKSINAQSLYLDSFNTFVKCLSLNVGHDNLCCLQSSLRQLLHRLIICVEESEIIPLLPLAIEKIFLPSSNANNMNGKIVQELMPLINQMVTKFKNSWMFQRDLLPFLKQMFMPIISSIFSLTSAASQNNVHSHHHHHPHQNSPPPEIMTPDEINSLQKTYYLFLSVLASNNVMDVFTNLEPNILEQILVTLVQGAVEFPDIPTQKSCFVVLRKLIECIQPLPITNGSSSGSSSAGCNGLKSGGGPSGVPTVVCMSPHLTSPAFIEYMYKNIVPACFYGPLKAASSTLESSGSSGGEMNQLINEIIAVLKTIQNVRGSEEFIMGYLQSNFFPSFFPSFSCSNEFINCLLTNDTKGSKESFKRFVQQFKTRSTDGQIS